MTDAGTPGGRSRKGPGTALVVVPILVIEGAIAAFLLLMSTFTSADVGAALLLGAVVALVGLVAAALLWRRVGAAAGADRAAGVAAAAWACRLLPFVAAVVAALLGLLGVVAWLGVALASFAAAPAAVLGMVSRYLVPVATDGSPRT